MGPRALTSVVRSSRALTHSAISITSTRAHNTHSHAHTAIIDPHIHPCAACTVSSTLYRLPRRARSLRNRLLGARSSAAHRSRRPREAPRTPHRPPPPHAGRAATAAMSAARADMPRATRKNLQVRITSNYRPKQRASCEHPGALGSTRFFAETAPLLTAKQPLHTTSLQSSTGVIHLCHGLSPRTTTTYTLYTLECETPTAMLAFQSSVKSACILSEERRDPPSPDPSNVSASV